ncbi:GGDEF-domain containing protein [Stutzerimonas nosocomialis]|uniref:putative bifunctional diguanylate cyclase/phosphodiesterase n=1 Tax=Stutzerimonas nosocomialis TaxID=1056496 RepID=UPI001107A814|nr:EAL domain-containing protein [Stutzerimonas nosocomialis]TLX58777.1 GGDEF-domain containing protein [Stutzerimonas nosocomialis]
MTLGKRALLVIFPVILIVQLLAASAAYLTQRASLVGLEQARLDQQLSALKSAFSDYQAFNRSMLYAISNSESLLLFLRESDTGYRNETLGLRIQQSIRSLSNTTLSFVSFAIVQPDGQPAYYFESSLSPFATLDAAQQRVIAEARRSPVNGELIYLDEAHGGPLVLHTDFILPASSSRPLPSQRREAFALQLAVRPDRFVTLKQRLEAEYGAALEIANRFESRRAELSAEVGLTRSLQARLVPSPDYLAERLQRLRLAFLFGSALVCLASIGLLLWLIRRYVTAPISRLDSQLTDLLLHRRDGLDEPSEGGEIGRLTVNMKTLHDRNAAALQRIQEISWTDTLTRISNRAHFGVLATAMFEQCSLHGGQLALLFMDLDNFKQVNDQHGHEAGDALLKAFAARVGDVLRLHQRQHPGTETSFARLSGDEFAILLKAPVQDDDTLPELTGALLGLSRGGFRLDGRTYPVSVSIGTARYPEDAGSITQLLTRADTAMYQAKAEGKNVAVPFSAQLELRDERIRAIEEQLRQLDGDRELALAFMPAVDGQGRVSACEALLRWHSPVLGVVSPAEFIPIAERAGLFAKIDDWVVDRAMGSYAELARLFGEDVVLAINVSSAQLSDRRICDCLIERARHHGIAPERIEIELTETYAAELSSCTMDVVLAIRAAGFRVAIDDFGVGYTSIQQMLEYPADTIKLDMAIVRRLAQPQLHEGLAAIVAFCKAQGKRVTAEGVDSLSTQAALLGAGCDLLQGYLISPPRPLDELAEWSARPYRERPAAQRAGG